MKLVNDLLKESTSATKPTTFLSDEDLFSNKREMAVIFSQNLIYFFYFFFKNLCFNCMQTTKSDGAGLF